MRRTDFALMPLSRMERLKYGKEAKSQLASMQIELRYSDFNSVWNTPLSRFEYFVYSQAWGEYTTKNVEAERFGILITSIASVGTSICKTLASGFNALGTIMAKTGGRG